jgi:sigma-B regulation protein RsbQ
MDVLRRNNVHVRGNPDGRPIVFAHGFGCSQDMWRLVTPQFEADHRVVLLDHVGAGDSDTAAYDPERHATLHGYVDDLIEVADELGIRGGIFVGHSVSSMIGVLADIRRPDVFDDLVLVGPSPRYLDDDGYRGGFGREDMDELLDLIDRNYEGWAAAMAPVIMANADQPELAQELEGSFCRTDPEIARQFARVTFLSDNRPDLGKVSARTLVLQCTDDVIAPEEVGAFVAESIPDSRLVQLAATGHCPNLSAPQETASTIREFLAA